MDEFIKKIFIACDKDQDGYLDRSDLEEVRKQIGLDGNISEIIEQFGASESGKISFKQFYENSSVLFGELNQSSSDSSPEYYTDSDTQTTEAHATYYEKNNQKIDMAMASEASKKGPHKNDGTQRHQQLRTDSPEIDLDLEASNERIKKMSELWDASSHMNQHRTSGGGIGDYLDQKTLLHLEKLKIIDPQPADKNEKQVSLSDRPSPSLDDMENELDISSGPDYLEMSKKLHLAALTSYKKEIHELRQRMQVVRKERDQLRKEKSQWQHDRQKTQQEFEHKLQSQTMRITELQSVIAELTRKLNQINDSKIIEEEEEEEDQLGSTSDMEVQGSNACSECSCDNCEHRLDDDGPNQVNYLATTHENADLREEMLHSEHPSNVRPKSTNNLDNVESSTNDLSQQLSRVLGALESTIEDRKMKNEGDVSIDSEGIRESGKNVCDSADEPANSSYVQMQLDGLLKQVESLKRDKKALEKQLHNASVQGYVYQKGNTTHVEDEFTKLRQENNYIRSKLRKAEQELDEVKTVNITVREEREKLKKKNRVLQESLEGTPRDPSPSPSNGSHGSGHVRSHSTHLDQRPISPKVLHRSTTSAADVRGKSQRRSNSVASPLLVQRSTSVHSEPGLPHSALSNSNNGFASFNQKGYTISPDSSLRRGAQHAVDSSDLGSSIGDEAQRSEMSLTLTRVLRGKIPETLLHTMLTYNRFDQIIKSLMQHFLSEVEERSKEAAINMERLESRMSHMQSQNDLLLLNLDESKQNSERLSLLCGKYESNSTAWSLALQNTEQLIETFEVMLQLQETEADIYAANCQAAGMGNFDTLKSLTSTRSSQSNISIASSIASSSQQHFGEDEDSFKASHSKRKGAETQAKLLLHKLDKKYENMVTEPTEDEMSYQSRTSTGSSQNSAHTDALSKDEQHRLRDYIQVLKTERDTYKSTVIIELESVHEYSDRTVAAGDAQASEEHSDRAHDLNIDLETAVILQEMQCLKEERAELKHRIYLLEKEKRALELKMNSREAQEQAYIVHIEHLKSEVKEQIRKRKLLLKDRKNAGLLPEEDAMSLTSTSTHSTNNPVDASVYPSSEESEEVSRRERHFKMRIQELMETLSKISKNSEIRHKQTAEYINDLKRANGALVTAYEKAKKRHASRLKKFEQQLVQMAEKYQMQVRALKEQINILKETQPNIQQPHTETSL